VFKLTLGILSTHKLPVVTYSVT